MKSGEEFRREGDKIFGAGSRNGVQITLLARNPEKDLDKLAKLHFATVPERSKLVQKFDWLGSMGNVGSDELKVVPVTPNHDWVNLTDGTFNEMIQVCVTSRKEDDEVVCHVNALGVTAACDPYVYSFDYDDLVDRVCTLIDAYDAALARVSAVPNSARKQVIEQVTKNTDLSRIKWTDRLKQSLRRGDVIEFDESRIRQTLYRPFVKVWLYEDARILSSVKAVSAMFAATPPPPPPDREGSGSHLPGSPQQSSHLRSHRHGRYPRPMRRRHEPALTGPPTEAIMITGTSNMAFHVLATSLMPDLAAIKGSQQTRVIPRTKQ